MRGPQQSAEATPLDPLGDVRAEALVERLLEDTWSSRSRKRPRRELLSESAAAVTFLAVAVPLAAVAAAGERIDLPLCALLLAIYGTISRTVRFPVGAGAVAPSYLVLAPMLLLLPPGVVPLLVALGLALASFVRFCAGRAGAHEMLFAIPDAWHTIGPALLFGIAGEVHGAGRVPLYLAAFVSACALDLGSSLARESLAGGVAPELQLRVAVRTWLLDLCFAPLGLGIGEAARQDVSALALLMPLSMLMVLANRDRTSRIAQAQQRLAVVARERSRLQSAVRHLGDAFAAKLDLTALAEVLLRGCIDALDACAGRVEIETLTRPRPSIGSVAGDDALATALATAVARARAGGRPIHVEDGDRVALAVPIGLDGGGGALAVARFDRPFSDDERELMTGLVQRAESAAAEIITHESLREQSRTDALTGLGNRRMLDEALAEALTLATAEAPLLLMLFDLDGFKAYNDAFGHPAGDALLVRLAARLRDVVAPLGSAYRLGGDEFCVLVPAGAYADEQTSATAAALAERGVGFEISASCGSAMLPGEASSADEALRLADRRMYGDKHARKAVIADLLSLDARRIRSPAHGGAAAALGR